MKRTLSPINLARVAVAIMVVMLVTGCVSRGEVEVPVESLFPQNCEQEVFYYDDEGKLVLDPGSRGQHLYYFVNLTNGTVWMDNSSRYNGANEGYITFLSSQRMAALALDKKPFNFVCSSSRKIGFEENVPCDDYVAVCKVKHARFMMGAHGTYWVTQDSLKSEFLHDLKLRGF